MRGSGAVRDGRIRTGLEWGASFAAVYSAYVVVLWLFRGEAPFEKAETTVVEVILAYCLAGLVGGTVFGILLPLGRSRLGAAFLGFLVALPVTYALGMAVEAPDRWFSHLPVVAVLSALLLGPACGLSMWYVNRRFERL